VGKYLDKSDVIASAEQLNRKPDAPKAVVAAPQPQTSSDCSSANSGDDHTNGGEFSETASGIIERNEGEGESGELSTASTSSPTAGNGGNAGRRFEKRYHTVGADLDVNKPPGTTSNNGTGASGTTAGGILKRNHPLFHLLNI
jgi:hypothetical protein